MEVGPSRDWVVTGPEDHGEPTVRLWTTRRLPFTSDQSEDQRHMVARVVPRLAQLKGERGDRLQAVFESDDHGRLQPDAENAALYNFGGAGFRFAPPALSFERSFAAPPPPPAELDGPARFHHDWSLVGERAPLASWTVTEPVARWDDVPLLLRGDPGIDTWLSMREEPGRVETYGELEPGETFLIAVDVTVPTRMRLSAVHLVKGIVDGAVAAFQRTDALDAPVLTRLLRRGWSRPMTAERLTTLAAASEPPPVFPRAPFNRNGLDPCDAGCVAGLLRLTTGDSLAMTGYLARVEPAGADGDADDAATN